MYDSESSFYRQIKSKIEQKPQIILYKIFGEEYFTFDKDRYEQKVDWSAFYTQLSPQHSMRYLTKKWDDGAEKACLIRFFIKKTDLRVLYIDHEALSNSKISGEIKAQNIKRHLKENYEQFANIQTQKLLKFLGQHQVLMSCVDAQDQQIIIPHKILDQDHFTFQHVASFQRSNDGTLRTIAFNKGNGWQKMPKQFHFEPYLLLNHPLWR